MSGKYYWHSSARKKIVNASHGLTVPSDDIAQLWSNFEKQYRKITYGIFHLDRVRSRIVTAIRNTVKCDSLVCLTGQCKPIDMVINLYVTVRLHHSVKEASRKLFRLKEEKIGS